MTSGIGSGAVVPITPMVSTLSSNNSEIGYSNIANGNNNIQNVATKFSGSGNINSSSSSSSEVFTCIAYCTDNQTVCVGTNQGNLYTWKKATGGAGIVPNTQTTLSVAGTSSLKTTSAATANYAVDGPENAWQLTNISMVRGAIKQCCWGINEVGKPCILLNCVSHVYLLKVS